MIQLPESLWRLQWRWRCRQYRPRPAPPCILLYHRIGDTSCDPLRLGVSPEVFERHLTLINRFGMALSVEEFSRRIQDGTLPRNAIAVSFDDGYKDNLTVAAPLLQRHQIPAMIFVASGLVEDQTEGGWDVLSEIFFELPPERTQKEVEFSVGRESWNFPALSQPRPISWKIGDSTNDPSVRIFLDWGSRYSRLPSDLQKDLLRQLKETFGLSTKPRPGRAFMTPSEVAACLGTGVLSIGAHTRTHPCLSSLSIDRQRDEIGSSRRKIAEWTGRLPELFAYPYGTYTDFGPATMRAVRDAGFSFGLANLPAAPIRGHRWDIPRVLVGEWDDDEFCRRIGLG